MAFFRRQLKRRNFKPFFVRQNIRFYEYEAADVECPNQVSGLSFLKDYRINKGTAFTLEERQHLTIQGLLPACVRTLETQVDLTFETIQKIRDPLEKYVSVNDVHNRNLKLFYQMIHKYIDKLMPIIYTPTVGLACQMYGKIFRSGSGIFITYLDKGNIKHILKNWPKSSVKAICVTDGERILGLGDLGCNGMNICVGKLILYTALASIRPGDCLPVLLDCGTNNEALLKDPYYMGLRMKRISGEQYYEFVDEFMAACTARFGPNVLIHHEDFASHNAIRHLRKYRKDYCIFNDDIQGTGAVGVAAIMSVSKALKKPIQDMNFLFVGAGGANMGISFLLMEVLTKNGMSKEEAAKHIFVATKDGLITTNMTAIESEEFRIFAKDMEQLKSLPDIIKTCKPTVLIGATSAPGLFNEEVLRAMAAVNERPVVFALSNPTSKAECTSEQAVKFTDGKVLYASGSPMPPVEYNGKKFHFSQVNNAYLYPGVALGILSCEAYRVTSDMFIIAAKEIVKFLSDKDFEQGTLFPKLSQINEVSVKIAARIGEFAFSKRLAALYPQPQDMEKYVRSTLYNFQYVSALPPKWEWDPLPSVDFSEKDCPPTDHKTESPANTKPFDCPVNEKPLECPTNDGKKETKC